MFMVIALHTAENTIILTVNKALYTAESTIILTVNNHV